MLSSRFNLLNQKNSTSIFFMLGVKVFPRNQLNIAALSMILYDHL